MGLEVTTMVSAADMDLEHSMVQAGTLRVPICARGKYLATAMISGADALSDGDINAVSEMVRLVLEPALFSIYLERQELNSMASNSQDSNDDTLSNVLPLQSVVTADFRAEDLAESFLISGWNHDRQAPEFSSSLLLLESKNPHTVARVAVHIHETGERWAMLRYADIKASLHSADDLRELGPMTLLIEDILFLSPEEQEVIAECATTLNPKTEPLILIGCTSPFQDLKRQGMVVPKLAEAIQDSRLELDRLPKDFSQLREVLELVLDRTALLN
jgi:hypothetical protein